MSTVSNSGTKKLNNTDYSNQQSPKSKSNLQNSQSQRTFSDTGALERTAPPLSNASGFGGSMLTTASQIHYKLEPIYPKIIDSVQPLMYDTNFGSTPNAPSQQKYKFQDKGMPILINYRALQNKARNQAIPVGILIEYFRQWIEIMKTQIDEIVNNLYERASNYTEKAIYHQFREMLTYNQKYMKYIMLSIIPSREIHQNPTLKLVEQTLSRQNLKLTACQHCYDFILECETYIEKVLCTEKLQPKETIQKEVEEIKSKYKKLISDVECKQIFKKFTSILETHFLNQFSLQAQEAKVTFNKYHAYRRQVGTFTDINLLDVESYDREDALWVYSEQLPEGNNIIQGLIQVEGYNNPPLPKSSREQSINFCQNLSQINEKLIIQLKCAPCFLIFSLEKLFASKFRLNMDSDNVKGLMKNLLESNLNFLQTIEGKIDSFHEDFKLYLETLQPEFERKWEQLISNYDQEVGSFIQKMQSSSPSQELSIDVEQRELFQELIQKGKSVENLYLDLWSWFGECRVQLEMENTENEEDKEVISRELNFIQQIQTTSINLRKGLYESKFLSSNPISLMEAGGLETQTKSILEFQSSLQNLQNQFVQLKKNNLLNKIFKELSVKDPLMGALLNPQMLEIINQVLSKPNLDAINEKIEYCQQIDEDIQSHPVKESTAQQLEERSKNLFRNLIYNELKASFKYEDLPEMKQKLQKSIADFTNTDVQTDQNDYTQKSVLVSLEKLNKIGEHLGEFTYPDFQAICKNASHIGEVYGIYNSVIGKQTLHIKVQTLKDALETTYKYFFSLQNPPVTQILSSLKPFIIELQDNLEDLALLQKKNFKDFEQLGKIINSQSELLKNINSSYSQFMEEIGEFSLFPFENMVDLLVPLKQWFVHIHQKVFFAESKRSKRMLYMSTCEEKDMGDIINDKIVKNKSFGIKGGMPKAEIDKVKQNLSLLKQEKWEISVEWEQKPRPTKVLIDICLPFKAYQCTVSMLDDSKNATQVYDNTINNDTTFKNSRVEFDTEILDMYVPFLVEISSFDEAQVERVRYQREIMIPCLEKEVKINIFEVGLSFEQNEEWKVYIQSTDRINWNPSIRVGAITNSQEKGQIVEIITQINAKQKQWENVILEEAQVGTYTFCINRSQKDHIYYLIIECDGCDKEIPTNDHKIYVNGRTSNLPQSITYSTADSQAMRKDKPIWMLGYIKQKIFYKTGVFLSKSEVEEHLQLPAKQQQ